MSMERANDLPLILAGVAALGGGLGLLDRLIADDRAISWERRRNVVTADARLYDENGLVARSRTVNKETEVMDKLGEIAGVLSNLADSQSVLADRVEELEQEPTVKAPTVTKLAPATGDLTSLRLACPESAAKRIDKWGNQGAPMLQHYLDGDLPKHMEKGIAPGTYRPSDTGSKRAYAQALLASIGNSGKVAGAVESSKPASTKMEKQTALRIECERRNFGPDLQTEVLADPDLHFRRDNNCMKSMSSSTVRQRIKAAK